MQYSSVDIKGYEGLYKIDEFGNVYSHHTRNQKHKQHDLLKQWVGNIGYVYIRLHKNGKKKAFLVHRLVAEHFIVKPESQIKLEVNHKDGNKLNNHVSNLEWATHQKNMQHARETGLYDESIYFREWIDWTSNQLKAFERSPYNIPACGFYQYPDDLKVKIEAIEAALELPEAVCY